MLQGSLNPQEISNGKGDKIVILVDEAKLKHQLKMGETEFEIFINCHNKSNKNEYVV